MSIEVLKMIFKSPTALVASVALLLASSGCTTNAPTNTAGPVAPTASASPAATASPIASPTPSATATAANLPVTLPVLDAMFADESFAGDLKSKLQLTDEQVTRLREISREETAKLSEQGAESGTTKDAMRRASEKIKSVVGDEKATAFNAFISERWSGGEGALAAKPNAVPTDTRIVVNAPAYRMDVFEGGKLLKTYRVGIGYPEFPLPQGLRKADTIIFNPTWTPPDEPWVKGKVKAGERVEAGSKLNPLGPIKIPIGQPSLIHGGKRPARLGNFASHGCVGLTDDMVRDFAVVLATASGTQLKPEDVLNYAKTPDKTQSVKLAAPVPVELRYETIVVEDGRLHIYRDVYDKGTNTEENLRRVLEAYGVKLEDLSEQERAQVLDALHLMARDAYGNPTEDAAASPTTTPAAKGKEKDKKKSGSVTYSVKGQKEATIDIAALSGKGYPAPVNLMGGPAPQQQSPAASPKKKAAGR
ncbi:MAG: L,D-transpeptidase ErfK/SrfK [Acidobacteriota bacterium]|jgi:lipoprotein-anchoring transpeptidase ErfK/SrfK|nr:L,D-transpeptidase ErfK/SrfK [Acidobacteriota bacterium]